MKKKLLIISVSGMLALGGLATIGAAAGARGSLSLTKATSTHADHGTTNGVERAFYAPGIAVDENGNVTGTGTKPYWRCDACCSGTGPDAARYSLDDKTTPLSLEDVVIPALTKTDSSAVSSGDQIANVNSEKFRYVDQGVLGVSGKDGASTPWYVQDEGKTAVYFSASGMTEKNPNCSEFRFTVPEEYKKDCVSVTFSYKYENWGDGTVNGNSMSEPSAFSAMVQFKDVTSAEIEGVTDGYSDYKGLNISDKLENHAGEWQSITLNYADSTGINDRTTNFTDFTMKFADLRGYIMISGLSYKVDDSITIDKTTSSDIAVGRSTKLKLSSGSDVTWSSSDESVATVDADGTVTGVKPGEATITAKRGDKTDSVVINVTNPVIVADEVTNLPASYKASLTHTYEVDVINDGKSKDAPFTFKADTKVTSNYSETTPSTDIPAMSLSADDMGTSPSESRYIKFTISKTGTYSIFSNNSDGFDTKLSGLYEVGEDGTVGTTGIASVGGDTYNDDFSKSSDAVDYCQYKYDFCFDVELEAGKSYVAQIKGGNKMLFGVINVEETDGVKTITSATGTAPKQTVNDQYSVTYVSNEILFSATGNYGFVQVGDKGYRFDYDSVENEYSYNSTLGSEGKIDDLYSWKAILSDPKIKWASTDAEEHHDVYYVDLSDSSVGDSPIINFAQALGIYGVAKGINVVSDYANNTISFSVVFNDGSDVTSVDISIEEATESPVTVNSYDVTHGGEAGSGSGVDDNWGE